MWLDRERNRFFGEVLREMLEWEEAGRKLHLDWRPEAVVIRAGEIDRGVHEEECRHLDPKALYELRLGKGESYRQALVAILRSNPSGLDFRSLCDELADRQRHQPSRATIRTVLYQSPCFFLETGTWRWRDLPDSSPTLRRRLILGGLRAAKDGTLNLAIVASAVSEAVQELVPSVPTSRLTEPTRRDGSVVPRTRHDLRKAHPVHTWEAPTAGRRARLPFAYRSWPLQ